jgi:hypothetical protein
MKKIILLFAVLTLFSSQALANDHWRYVLVYPDGTQVFADDSSIDLSYPPITNDNQDSESVATAAKPHLIIVSPDYKLPEPMFLPARSPESAKTAEATPEAKPDNSHVATNMAAKTSIPVTYRPPSRPPRRAFLLF